MITLRILVLALAGTLLGFLPGCNQPTTQKQTSPPPPPPAAALDCAKPNACVLMANAGQGNCVVVLCPTGEQVVVDCGTVKGGNTIPGFLDSINAKQNVRSIIISHGDLDHYSFIPDQFPLASVPKLTHVTVADDYQQWKNDKIKQWLNSLPAHRVSLEVIGSSEFDQPGTPRAPVGCSSPAGAGFYVMTAYQGRTPNDKSIVLKYQPGGDPANSIILPGDATKSSEKAAIDNYKKDGKQGFLSSYALLVGHHGSGSDVHNTPEWVQLTQPRAIVFSSAGQESTQFHHPRCITAGKFFSSTSTSIAGAQDHIFGCWEQASGSPRVYNWNDAIDEYRKHAVFSTDKGGLIVFRWEAGSSASEIWSCPDNLINGNCKKEAPK